MKITYKEPNSSLKEFSEIKTGECFLASVFDYGRETAPRTPLPPTKKILAQKVKIDLDALRIQGEPKIAYAAMACETGLVFMVPVDGKFEVLECEIIVTKGLN